MTMVLLLLSWQHLATDNSYTSQLIVVLPAGKRSVYQIVAMVSSGSRDLLYPIHLAAKLGDALALQAIIDAGADMTKKTLGPPYCR